MSEPTFDLLGQEIKPVPASKGNGKRKATVRKGYAAPPGTGPAGETCGSCEHSRKCGNYGCKQFYKCELMKAIWTGGQGTDILVKAPACRKWEKDKNEVD